MRSALIVTMLLASCQATAGEKSAPAKPAAPPTAAAPPAAPAGARTVEVKVTDKGFEPSEVRVKAGQPTTLAFTRTTDNTCITAIDIPGENVKGLNLPLNRVASVTITPKKAGSQPFHCTSMQMGDGKLVVE
jgi:plastocyanin domain-containing protein